MTLWHFLRYGSLTHEMLRGRDPLGRLTEQCTACGYSRVVLGEEIKKGPACQQAQDLGAVKTKAIRDTKFQQKRRIA